MSTLNELEKSAAAYAREAVKFDQQGNKEKAIALYRKASENLLRLSLKYPEYGLNKVYAQRAIDYQERIKILQGFSPANF